MAQFDFVESASAGYRFIWKARRNIARMAAIPFFVKMGSYAAISLWALEENFLRQGLVQLPAFFLEGFVVALVIRMALFEENYTNLFQFGAGLRGKIPEERYRAIMAAVAIYMLTKLVASLFAGTMMAAQEIEKMPGMPEPQGSVFVTSAMILIFMLWAFRFFWLYVPAAMGISIAAFLKIIQSYSTSFYILGLWLLCFVPLAAVLVGIAKTLMAVFPGATEGHPSAVYLVVMAGVQAGLELLIAMTSGVAMAYAVRSLFTRGSGKPPRFL